MFPVCVMSEAGASWRKFAPDCAAPDTICPGCPPLYQIDHPFGPARAPPVQGETPGAEESNVSVIGKLRTAPPPVPCPAPDPWTVSPSASAGASPAAARAATDAVVLRMTNLLAKGKGENHGAV